MTVKEIELLNKIADILDDELGDTDPFFDDDMTDEDIKDEHPLFWACQQLNKLLQQYDKDGKRKKAAKR